MTLRQEKQRQGQMTAAHHDFNRNLNSHAFFKVHNHALGEDLVQDTFTKTWKYLVRGGKIEMMQAFLYHVLNNLIVDHYRKHATLSLDTLQESGFEPSSHDSGRIMDILDGKGALLLIARLPLKYQKVMRMRYVQDLSLQEISLITGQSKNAIGVQMHRGLEKLKLLYKRSPYPVAPWI